MKNIGRGRRGCLLSLLALSAAMVVGSACDINGKNKKTADNQKPVVEAGGITGLQKPVMSIKPLQ